MEDESLRPEWALTLGWKPALAEEVPGPFIRAAAYHIFAAEGLRMAKQIGMAPDETGENPQFVGSEDEKKQPEAAAPRIPKDEELIYDEPHPKKEAGSRKSEVRRTE